MVCLARDLMHGGTGALAGLEKLVGDDLSISGCATGPPLRVRQYKNAYRPENKIREKATATGNLGGFTQRKKKQNKTKTGNLPKRF